MYSFVPSYLQFWWREGSSKGYREPREKDTKAPNTSEVWGDQLHDSILETSQEHTKQDSAFCEDGNRNRVKSFNLGFSQLTCFDPLWSVGGGTSPKVHV